MQRHWPIARRVSVVASRRVTALCPPGARARLHLPAHKRTTTRRLAPDHAHLATHRPAVVQQRRTMSAAPDASTTTTAPSSPPAKRVKTDENGTTMTAAPATQEPRLLVKKLSDKARTPTRGSAFAAGYDVYAARDTTVPARGKVLVDTDISIACPPGTYGRIAPRSGLAAKHFIDTGAGVIDEDYRGQVKVLLFNHAETDFEIKEGDRIAQLVLERIYTPEVLEVTELEESARGAGGFGSTG